MPCHCHIIFIILLSYTLILLMVVVIGAEERSWRAAHCCWLLLFFCLSLLLPCYFPHVTCFFFFMTLLIFFMPPLPHCFHYRLMLIIYRATCQHFYFLASPSSFLLLHFQKRQKKRRVSWEVMRVIRGRVRAQAFSSLLSLSFFLFLLLSPSTPSPAPNSPCQALPHYCFYGEREVMEFLSAVMLEMRCCCYLRHAMLLLDYFCFSCASYASPASSLPLFLPPLPPIGWE